MNYRGLNSHRIWRTFLAAGFVLALALAAAPMAADADGVDPDADKIPRSMSTHLGGLPAFSMSADIDIEIVNLDGQKLQLSASSAIVVERPGKFHITRKGMIGETEFLFDGKTLTIYVKRINAYAQLNSPGTIDDAIRTFENETGLDAPGADLLFADSYANFTAEAPRGAYLGVAHVNGVPCHYLAFRQAKVDWQLWVKTGEEPLPMKYVITSKWITGAPQYSIRFRDWSVEPRIDQNIFTFSAPEGAEKLETIPVDETGEVVVSEEGSK